MKLHNNIINILERNGFKVGEVTEQGIDCYIDISQYTPLGEDWNETIWFDGTNEGFIRAVHQRYATFDIDEEAEIFIECRGKNGVPSSIKALIGDAEWKKDKLDNIDCSLGILNFDQTQRIKQISLDILVDGDTDGDQLAEEIKVFLEVNNYDVLGAAFTEDMTDAYKKEYGCNTEVVNK